MSADESEPVASLRPDREALAVFHAVFDSLSHAVLVAGDDGAIVFGNQSAALLFACTPAELVNDPLSARVQNPSDSASATDWTRLAVLAGRPARAVAGVRRDAVLVPLEVSVNALSEGGSQYYVISLQDQTTRLRLEARLAAAGGQGREFERLVADLAARLGEIDPAALNETMADGLRQLGEALAVDQIALWQWQPSGRDITPLHAWQRDALDGIAPIQIASVPYITSRVQSHEVCCFTSIDEIPDAADRDTLDDREVTSIAVMPLVPAFGGGHPSALVFSTLAVPVDWTPLVERLRLVTGVVGQALVGLQTAEALQRAMHEVRALRERVEWLPPRREGRTPHVSNMVAADSAAMKAVLAQVEQVTGTGATVLLLGETGTGKEVMAQTIHDLSPRHQRQMVRVSCAAIPTALIESELFGRERGAYTGALSRQIGRFEAANQSTLFLDEIGELPPEVQVKLLRVLQERVIERLGSTQPVKVDVRIIAATNRDLEKAVEEKTFREDLFYRLNVFPIVVPPLRERTEDIPGLVWAFIDEFSKNFGKTIKSISKESMHDLQRYAWPGNVRELRNVIERAVIVSTSPELVVSAPRPPARMPQNAMTLSALEIEHIRAVLDSTHWRVRGKGGAAQRLGLKPTTLESRMAKFGIIRKKPQ